RVLQGLAEQPLDEATRADGQSHCSGQARVRFERPSAQRLRIVRQLQSGTTWTVSSLVAHGFLAFASAEHYRPAEQYRVKTVEHDRRRDKKLLDAQGEDEMRPHRGFEDEAQAPDDVADADGAPEAGRT